ncbi:hypothetical protein AOT82_1740 [Psychrobacter sp. AntiMn-1]|nr:hypothetical protein AOT82_1740 [Psychrobacter sp. AntiMn-1]
MVNHKHITDVVRLYRDEPKKHQAQPNNAFISYKALLSIKA